MERMMESKQIQNYFKNYYLEYSSTTRSK
jgi:hypothetical protein